MADTEPKEHIVVVETENLIKIWCDGREYDPTTESYHPVYSYSIITPGWRYDDNDLRGAANEIPDLNKATQSLLGFLYAGQEAYARIQRGQFASDNAELFPEHVNEWAYQYNDNISILASEMEKKGGENA